MNNNHLPPQTTQIPRQLPLPPGQRQPQPDHSAFWAVAQRQHPQQSRFQVPPSPPPAHNPQWAGPPPSRPPPPDQSAFYTNDDHGSRRHGQQHQYHVPPSVAQPLPRLVAQPDYNVYQPTARYPRHYVPQPVASPQPQLAYDPHPQTVQQQRWYHSLLPCLVQTPERPQRFDGPNLNNEVRQPTPQPQFQPVNRPNLNRQAQQHAHPPPQPHRRAQQHAPPLPQPRFQYFDGPELNGQVQQHAHLPLQPQFQPLPPPPAQNTGVYPDQSQGSRRDGWQPSVDKGAQGVNRGRRGHDRGARGGPGNRDEIADRSRDVRAHGSERTFGGVASIQAEACNTIPTTAEPDAVPVATQLQNAQNVNVSGNPTLMNIGTNTGNLTTVNNYGGTHGLEKLEKFVSFAALHDSAEQDPDRRCHPGTRNTVLKRLRDWFDNPNTTDRIFWLNGPAGAGKSAIAQTIANEYKKRGVAATFFFFRSDPNRNNGNRLFPTIAWQLAFSVPPTKDLIVRALNETPHCPTQAVEVQFEQLVVHPFRPRNKIASQMSQPAPVVIIDGVDECSVEKLQQRFLTVIGDAVKNHDVPLRFLISSRPEALIEETLNKFTSFIASIDLAKLDDSNRDIRKYLEEKFSEIAPNRGLAPTWPGQEIIEEIVSKSSGNFIFASLVIRFISDEDCDPDFLLSIVRNLAPRGNMTPFALLDELFLEILKRQRDQDFLKTFLALLVARISITGGVLHKDDALLMNVSEKDLHIRLRRMRSLLKFEPFIDVYHKSFLDFLQDPSRSGQYYVSKHGGQKRYLELIVDSIFRHISVAIEQPNCHMTCRSSPAFKVTVTSQPPKIVLPVEVWQEVLKPLLDLQDKFLRTPKPQACRVIQVMRDLLLHLLFLQRISRPITPAQVAVSNMNKVVTEWSPEAQDIPEKDLDSCLSALLSSLQKTDLVMPVDRAMIDRVSSLLAFDYVETVDRVQTVSDAQKLMDLLTLLANHECLLRQCGPDAACKAARLTSEIFARVSLLPQSLFVRKPGRYIQNSNASLFESVCQTAFISRILDHNYIVPVLGIYDESNRLRLISCENSSEQNESVDLWLRRSSPNLVTRIRVVLEVARTIRYIHSMDVALYSKCIHSSYFFLNSNLRAKFEFIGLFAWWVREASIYGHEYDLLTKHTIGSNISAFAELFHEVCVVGHSENLCDRLVVNAKQLIERCLAKDPESRPTMKDVVTEMETWDLT